jgi:hypothetical protein
MTCLRPGCADLSIGRPSLLALSYHDHAVCVGAHLRLRNRQAASRPRR